MAALRVDEHKQVISHAINNRLNTLTMGIAYLENISSDDTQTIVRSLKLELRDLQALIDKLRHS